MQFLRPLLVVAASASSVFAVIFALTVPNEVQQPGTQQNEVVGIERSENCRSCHAYYDADVEPYNGWMGSMMAHAGRDPIFWAAMAVAEQDFDGSGDLCIRCHSPKGWLEDRSTPTDGSALIPSTDGLGIECQVCHRLTNPDDSEHLGVQNPPFVANTGGASPEAFYGSGQMVLADNYDRYGPYGSQATAAHGVVKSEFHRSSALCGTCHDVSNPVVGDLAHNNGSSNPLPPGNFDGTLGGPLTSKAAFLNKPHSYGVTERTFSEHMSSSLADYKVSDYPSLPNELQGGILESVYQAAIQANTGGDYEDGTTRYYTCQSCHMQPAVGKGSSYFTAPLRLDVPTHDLTGGNTTVGKMILNLDARGKLILGGGLSAFDERGIEDGEDRARLMLKRSANLELVGNNLRIYNLTGHKLFTGYPEGRRMWLNMRWYDASGNLLREDGRYGNKQVQIAGRNISVKTLLDPYDPNSRLWHVEGGMTQEWAEQLVSMGTDPNIALSYDTTNSSVLQTLGDLAIQPAGTVAPTLHFIFNNIVLEDNRIPPYEYSYDSANTRNCLPVPATQYGNPGAGGTYNHYDDITLNPPSGAASGKIRLIYQTTSWEYIQFLFLANDGSVPFLANTGLDLAKAWYQTGMSQPEVMASINW
ncbi:MAG: hypothetical protein OSB63_05140 [Planctomycetota bacterium]|nr:hypothetical protein [Planctomycetota bacterium]